MSTTTAKATANAAADYLTSLTQQAQDASRAATQAWVRAVQGTSVRLPSVASVALSHEVIDQVSDLTISLVNVQRTLAKQFTETAVGAVEGAVERAQQVQEEVVAG